MKISPTSLAAALPAIAFLSCSPSNRYIESASTTRLPQSFAPILRNQDEKAGLEFGAGFGFSTSGPMQGTSKETRLYETEKDETGIEKKVLTVRQFGREGKFENRFPGFASHATAAFYTDTPLGIHAEAAFSQEDADSI